MKNRVFPPPWLSLIILALGSSKALGITLKVEFTKEEMFPWNVFGTQMPLCCVSPPPLLFVPPLYGEGHLGMQGTCTLQYRICQSEFCQTTQEITNLKGGNNYFDSWLQSVITWPIISVLWLGKNMWPNKTSHSEQLGETQTKNIKGSQNTFWSILLLTCSYTTPAKDLTNPNNTTSWQASSLHLGDIAEPDH